MIRIQSVRCKASTILSLLFKIQLPSWKTISTVPSPLLKEGSVLITCPLFFPSLRIRLSTGPVLAGLNPLHSMLFIKLFAKRIFVSCRQLYLDISSRKFPLGSSFHLWTASLEEKKKNSSRYHTLNPTFSVFSSLHVT